MVTLEMDLEEYDSNKEEKLTICDRTFTIDPQAVYSVVATPITKTS